MIKYKEKWYAAAERCGEPPVVSAVMETKHNWWQTGTYAIGCGEASAEYSCTKCGASREEIFDNGTSGWWGEPDADRREFRGEDENGTCRESVAFDGSWRGMLAFLGFGEDDASPFSMGDGGAIVSFLPIEASAADADSPCVKIAGQWFMLIPETALEIAAREEEYAAAESRAAAQPWRMRGRKKL